MKKTISTNACNRINNQRGSISISLLLILILGVLLMSTTPDEARMREQIIRELAPAAQMETFLTNRFGELAGTIRFYHEEYIFYSTLSVEEDGKKELVAVGVAGQVFTQRKLERIRETLARVSSENHNALLKDIPGKQIDRRN